MLTSTRIQLDMNQLPPGTLVETDELIGLSVGDNMLAILSSEVFDEGSIVRLEMRGPNDWVILRDEELFHARGWWISLDWNGKIKSREFDAYGDIWDDYYDEWCGDLDERLDRYQDYDY